VHVCGKRFKFDCHRENIMSDVMRETEDIASRRKACKEMKELLQRALEIVNEVCHSMA
jgi:dynamin 1-like protein